MSVRSGPGRCAMLQTPGSSAAGGAASTTGPMRSDADGPGAAGSSAMGPVETSTDPATGQTYSRPSHSYSALIEMAIRSTKNGRIRLNDIYDFVSARFPFYQFCTKNWKVRPQRTLKRAGARFKGEGG